MRKYIVLCLLLVCTIFTSGCMTERLHGSHFEEVNAPKKTEGEFIRFERNGCLFSLPEQYRNTIIVNPEGNHEPYREDTLFEVYYKPAYEQGKQLGFTSGLLFAILQLNRAEYEQYLVGGDWITEYAFALDDNYYYIMVLPSDIQILNAKDSVPYNKLLEVCLPVAIETMIEDNGLFEYSDNEFWESSETYPGEHIYYKYFPYYAYDDVETSENKNLFYTLMLSQPVRQGNDGIWCVERVYDSIEYAYLYAIFPENEELSAMDTYKQAQLTCDNGSNQQMLDPMSVALDFVHSYYGHTKATKDSFEEVQCPPEGEYRF